MSTFLRNKTISKTTPLRKENPFPQFNVASHKRPGIRLSFEYTTTLLSGEGGEGRTGTATMFRKMLSKYTIFSTVLSKVVVVNHLSVETICTIFGSFGTFIIFALQSVSWRDKLYFNSITFKNSPISFKYWRTCILIRNILFWKKDHHAVGLPHPKLKPVIFLLRNLFLTLINIPRLRFSHFVIGTINW